MRDEHQPKSRARAESHHAFSTIGCFGVLEEEMDKSQPPLYSVGPNLFHQLQSNAVTRHLREMAGEATYRGLARPRRFSP